MVIEGSRGLGLYEKEDSTVVWRGWDSFGEDGGETNMHFRCLSFQQPRRVPSCRTPRRLGWTIGNMSVRREFSSLTQRGGMVHGRRRPATAGCWLSLVSSASQRAGVCENSLPPSHDPCRFQSSTDSTRHRFGLARVAREAADKFKRSLVLARLDAKNVRCCVGRVVGRVVLGDLACKRWPIISLAASFS